MSMLLAARASVHYRISSQLSYLARLQTQIQHNTYSTTTPELTNNSVTSQTSNDSPASTGKTRTKKSLAQLPKRLVLEDGKAAKALPSFEGGLKGPRKARRKNDEDEPDNLKNNSSDDITGDINEDISTSSRRGRRKHITLVSSDKETPSTRRKRKSTSSTVAEPDTTTNELVNKNVGEVLLPDLRREPRNQLAREILENLSRFPHCILLTRVGQFYESYFDQAQEVASLLSIKLTKRTWGGQRVWMCGFPLMHLDKHLKTLVQQHKRSVALCEEFQRPRDPLAAVNSKPVFDRRVVRILTPGTLIDESFLNPYENNYLLAISSAPDNKAKDIGLAWIDVSTGEFFTRSAQLSTLKDHLVRIDPQEVVIDKSFGTVHTSSLLDILNECGCHITYATTAAKSENIYSALLDTGDNVVEDLQASGPSAAFSTAETSAIDLLTDFLHNHLLEHTPSLQPTRENVAKRMQIDAHTLKGLEIKEGIREGGTTGSLMSAVKRTVTGSGTRLLARWLCSPSTSIDEIKARHDLVELFCARPSLRADVIECLKSAEDASRITQRFLLGRGKTDDLVAIQHTIETWEAVKKKIALEKTMESEGCPQKELGTEWKNMDMLLSRVADVQHIAKRIESAVEVRDSHRQSTIIDEAEEATDAGSSLFPIPELPSKVYCIPGADTNWTIKPEFSPELEALHDKLRNLLDQKDKLQEKFQNQYDAPSLTLRSSPSLGMHAHLSKGRRDSERIGKSQQFSLLTESNSTKAYFNKEWFSLGSSVLETVLAILAAERQAFLMLREEVNANSSVIRRSARVFDELDVITSFAALASEMNFVKPSMTEGMEYFVVNGRHPTVEQGLLSSGRPFTPNTIYMDDSSRLQIITGPNMAGKSTFLRQTALIAILAQAGCFVPADTAQIGLVDKVFSRVGAKDDLFRDRSTFMVEMLETGEILQNATDRSLVIMDEVGRGTTTYDGLAIAFAAVFHLYFKNQCRALFATHFHELVDMMGYSEKATKSELFPNASFYCTDVVETEDNHFAYSYRLKPGVNRDSHGLKVAKLGGLPLVALIVAENALASLKAAQRDDGSERQYLAHLGMELVGRHCHGS